MARNYYFGSAAFDRGYTETESEELDVAGLTRELNFVSKEDLGDEDEGTWEAWRRVQWEAED